jgi:hypothetical protein
MDQFTNTLRSCAWAAGLFNPQPDADGEAQSLTTLQLRRTIRMSHDDVFDELLRGVDRPVAPSARFATDLRQRLLKELDSPDDNADTDGDRMADPQQDVGPRPALDQSTSMPPRHRARG